MDQETANDLLEECPCKEIWCFPRELLLSCLELTERDAEQLRLISDEKYMDSKKNGEIDKETAAFEFIKLHAAKFAEVYQKGKKKDELFKEVFGFEKVHTDEYVNYVHQETLDDLLEECPYKDKWCFPKEILSYQSKKQAEKFRLRYVYKFLKSKEEGKDIGEERMKEEFKDKYQKLFDEVYRDDMKLGDLIKAVFNEN